MSTTVIKCAIHGSVFACIMRGKKYTCDKCARPCKLCEDNHGFDIITGLCDQCEEELCNRIKIMQEACKTLKK
jgi:hypothetical protein